MFRVPVSSSNVSSIGYDPETRVLEVEFNNYSVYQYSNVPPSIHAGLMAASSHGGYLHAHVKGVYSYRRVS